MFDIVRYTESHAEEWNTFVKTSKNGTFLMNRGYMDYHSDRFADHSLLFYLDGRLEALLPANERQGTLFSHQGLTYGGLVIGERITARGVMTLFSELNDYLRHQGIHLIIYKAIPHIYHRVPAEEDLYALQTVCQAKITQRHISSAICPSRPVKWRRDRHYGANKALTNGIVVERSDDFGEFWPILEDNLTRTYGAKPVHTLEEMELLHSRFPEEIVLYLARREDGTPVAGTVLYVTPQVVHAQYISASPEGKHLHAVDALFRQIIEKDYVGHPYIDFGKSTEDDGTVLNETLIYQKEGFGGRGVCYDWYEWSVEC